MEEIKLPQLGQSVEEASIVQWFKKEGDTIQQGDLLFSIQTDKAEIEYESPVEGTLRKILVQEDIEVPVLTVVALVGKPEEPLPDLSSYTVSTHSSSNSAKEEKEPAGKDVTSVPSPSSTPVPLSIEQRTYEEKRRHIASPRARRKAESLQINPEVVSGSGPRNRVLSSDIEAYEERLRAIRITPTARRIAMDSGIDITQLQGTGEHGRITKEDVLRAKESLPSLEERVTPLSPMRRIIASRMVESKFSAPHYYITMEIDMKKAIDFRETQKEFRPSFNDIILYAVSRGLARFPQVNASWEDNSIREHGHIHVGFAVALPAGLVVPVIRNIHTMTLEQIHQEATRLVEKARSNTLTPDEFTGSTFTVSNLGAFGVEQFTAIINQPNSAILAIGCIKDRVVVKDGGIHIRPIMKMTLSSDHRVIDGAVAAQFMSVLRDILETGNFSQ